MSRHVPIGAISPFRRRLPRLSARGASQPGEPGRRPPPRRPARGPEPVRHRRARPRAGRLRPAPPPDRSGAPARPTEQVEHPIVAANIEARMFELGGGPHLGANPQVYADVIGTSLAGQALFAYAPEAERARRVVSKLRQVPRLVQAARDNIKECPGHLRQGRARDLARRRSSSSRPICRARSRRSTTCTSSATSPTRRPRRPPRSRPTSTTSRPTWRRARRRRSGWAASKFEQKLKLEEGITLSAERLLAIALRELRRGAGGVPQRRRPAERRRPDRGLARRRRSSTPSPGKLVAGRAGAGQGARGVPAAPGDRVAARVRAGRRRAVAGVLPLGVCEHVDARARSRASQAAPTTT